MIADIQLTANIMRVGLIYLIDSYKVKAAISREVLLNESELLLGLASRRLAER